jgi:hypothetical protein
MTTFALPLLSVDFSETKKMGRSVFHDVLGAFAYNLIFAQKAGAGIQSELGFKKIIGR